MIGLLIAAGAVAGLAIVASKPKKEVKDLLPPGDVENAFVDDTLVSTNLTKPTPGWDDFKKDTSKDTSKNTSVDTRTPPPPAPPASSNTNSSFQSAAQKAAEEAARKKQLAKEAAERARPDRFPLQKNISRGERVSTLQRKFAANGIRNTGVYDQALEDIIYNRFQVKIVSESLYNQLTK
jgi:hypothetical protein